MPVFSYLNKTTTSINNDKCAKCKKGFYCVTHNNADPKYHQDEKIISVARNICLNYAKGITEQVLLAQTQSGKSDVIKRLAELLKLFPVEMEKDFGIKNIFVLECANDNVLRDDLQTKLSQYVNKGNVQHMKDIEKLVKYLEALREGQKITNELFDKTLSNCLIIIDEAHSDTKCGQLIDKLRRLLEIEPNKIDSENTIRVLNISATPYAQVKAGIRSIVLHQRKGYYGISDMNKNEKIFSSFDLNKKDNLEVWFNHMTDQLNVKRLPDGYYIVRVDNENDESSLTKNIEYLSKKKIKKTTKVISYNMHSDFNLNKDYLEKNLMVLSLLSLKID